MSLYESHYGAHYGAHYEVQCMSLKLNVSFVRSIPLSHCKSHYKSHCKWKAIAKSLLLIALHKQFSLALRDRPLYTIEPSKGKQGQPYLLELAQNASTAVLHTANWEPNVRSVWWIRWMANHFFHFFAIFAENLLKICWKFDENFLNFLDF